MRKRIVRISKLFGIAVVVGYIFTIGPPAQAVPVPGGSLIPTTIPKYVIPLVIPPVMPKSTASPAPAADYDIAVRQFKQQILPGGVWNVVNGRTDAFGATTVWSYGRSEDSVPAGFVAPVPVDPASPLGRLGQGSSFNYPAFTVENTSGTATSVRWINDLVDAAGNYLPHLFPVDQTLHWANPPTANCVMGASNRTDCETAVAAPYTGPVPLVTHVHGAHVQPHSDGYPEAWWLPGANNIPASYSLHGSLYTQGNNANIVPGSAFYAYTNNQPAATIWYHDHAMGITRLNVYAGPAGFWLIRGGVHGDSFVDDGTTATANDGILPAPAPTGTGDPNFNAAYRSTIREIPVAIQDRSFNTDGSLFYPQDRTFFDGFTGPFIGNAGYTGPYAPGPPPVGPSDMSGIWNPEAFFNTMVVNGATWPKFEVAPARYRLRLLNGCNSRTINLSMFKVINDPDGIPGNADDDLRFGPDGVPGTVDDLPGKLEVPFYQIGGDQGFLPQVVEIVMGTYTTLPGNGTTPAGHAFPDPAQALLMMPAERADVIVDFTGLANGTRIRMINTAPDAPFGGFPVVAADTLTTGQVMDFIVNTALTQTADGTTTPPQNLVLPAEGALGATAKTRQLSLNELMSDQVCVEINSIDGSIVGTLFSTMMGDANFLTNCAAATVTIPGNLAQPMGPRHAHLGTVEYDPVAGNLVALPKSWSDPITEVPALHSTETWELYNTTADAHPIHLHLVRFQVIDRQNIDPVTLAPVAGTVAQALPNEGGYKDTVVTYPGQVTRLKAKFDIAGLYVWHCHIIEHEDNEMMRPMIVNPNARDSILWRHTAGGGENALWSLNGITYTGTQWIDGVPDQTWSIIGRADFNGDGQLDILWRHTTGIGENAVWYMNSTTHTGSGWIISIADQNWKIVGLGDFNGDAKPDLLWRNTTSGENVVWFMNGTELTGSAWLDSIADQAWTIAGTGDFNGDAKPDLLWRNTTSGENVVWHMNGTTRTASAWLEPIADQSWTVGTVGDFNGDVNVDIVWRNTATGENLLWYMNGATHTGNGSITAITDLNWVMAK